MKAKMKTRDRFNYIQHFSVNKRGYYFHADEDFMEDWNWGKNEVVELKVRADQPKKSTDGLLYKIM